MHTYQNLKTHLSSTGAARSVAGKMLLLHGIFGNDASKKIVDILKHGGLSPVHAKKQQSTHRAEELLEIPASVYFFAGRAHPRPEVVAVVAVAAAEHENDAPNIKGGVTPFDSGGVATHKTHLRWMDFATDQTEYFWDHNLGDLWAWRDYLALFLSAFFNNPAQYWNGLPDSRIDNTSFEQIRNPRKWLDYTFEVRSNTEMPIRCWWKVYVKDEVKKDLQNEVKRYPHLAPVVSRFRAVDKPAKEAESEAKALALASEEVL